MLLAVESFKKSFPPPPDLENTYNSMNGNKEKADDGIEEPKVQLYTGKIHVEWKQVHKIGAGLNNLGNTCFMNTVIQCLTYCPPLANYLLHDNDHPTKCTITGFCMMCVLQKHMKRAIGKTGEIIKPLDVYQRLKLIAKHFQYGRQEDAHEFLRFVIDNLVQSCLAQRNVCTKLDPASKETTIINQIFGGYHRSQVTCLSCKTKSNKYDHFMEILVDVKQNVLSLEKALEKSIQPELLHLDNSYSCPKCKTSVAAQKKYTVYRAPNVATFQLKRFDYNRSFGGKITKQITYPEKLNMRPYMSEPKGDPVLYRLNAVLVHTGASCNSGHYYCYVKNSNGYWYIMDDQRVHQVSLNQVLNQGAYILFYVKMESSENSFLKKCLENKNSVMKGNISSPNYKKVPDLSTPKPSPLNEINQVTSSPSAKVSVYSFPSVNKQQSFSPNFKKDRNFSPTNKNHSLSPNRKDRVSFGFRISNSSDLNKSPSVVNSVDKKPKPSPVNSNTNNSLCGLVPYVQDSSDSSDENENVQLSNTKAERTDAFNVNNAENKNLGQNIVKPSKSVFNAKSSPSAIPSNTSCTKVIATESWTVTEAPNPASPISNSSNSVSTTAGWQVIIDSPVEKQSNSVSISDDKFSEESKSSSGNNSGTSSGVDKPEFPLKNQTKSPPETANSESASQRVSSNDRLNRSDSKENSPSSKCNFRRQSSENETFYKNEKIHSRESNSFLKRKCSDSDQKVLEDSKFSYNESRSGPLFKKHKYSEELSEKELNSSDKNFKFSTKNSDRCNTYEPSASTQNDAFHKNSSSQKVKGQQNGVSSGHSDDRSLKKYVNNKSDDGSESDSDSNSSSSSSSSSSKIEYEWVEKTQENTKNVHHSASKDKLPKTLGYYSSPSKSQVNSKQNVVAELTKNSSYVYGAKVPTWKGGNHYREFSSIKHENRKSYDNYDDEFDRGKFNGLEG
ncbi:ubiquitin carboxyl-terminal hydrolase 36-like [Uloborus diversus]|uniref:ubiquitin carboxyl-terminal hydrolase 36-like n=1 Tax=Uloborus diversus TaxID=327109 RepID=UPI002409D302|nr:ubiquitin carboxyl-terminal hydrolase 36-like [Uloborus diversus]